MLLTTEPSFQPHGILEIGHNAFCFSGLVALMESMASGKKRRLGEGEGGWGYFQNRLRMKFGAWRDASAGKLLATQA